MKAFDSSSIFNRKIASLSQEPDWKAILSDSVVSAILKNNAESNAEIARYAEYLFNESRWDAARNLSSLTAQAGQLGYKAGRKKSATGEIYISADPTIHQVGRRIFKDDFINENVSNWGVLSQAVPITSNFNIVDANGTSYIFSSLNQLDQETIYCKNTIIQGVKKSVIIPAEVARLLATRSRLDPYIFIPIELANCENASDATTQSFLKVLVNYSSTTEEYRVVDSLHLSSSSDMDVEIYPDLYNSNLLYLKFNASPNRGKILNLSEGSGVKSIEIQYVETLGSEGNLSSVFNQFTITNPDDPNLVLYGINLSPIVGGADEETAFEIKTNAPKSYLSTYTTATKEAYEAAISSIPFGSKVYPTRVRVYAGLTEDPETKIVKSTTNISMIIPNLEDLISTSDTSNPYIDIERNINLHLMKLKAPTDILKFVMPNYVGVSMGIVCTADRSKVDNLATLRSSIQAALDSNYGSTSSELDFARKIHAADVTSLIRDSFPEIQSVKYETEAVIKLDWNSAEWMTPVESIQVKTCRLNFSFDPIFIGNSYIKGFKDYRVGASYVMRFDILFKKAMTSTLPAYHTSIFVKENPNRSTPAFYAVHEKSSAPVWMVPDGQGGYLFNQANYTMDNSDYEELTDLYQFYFKKKVYDDDSFASLVSPENLLKETTLSDYTLTPGSIDSYLISFTGDLDSVDGSIADGFFEFEMTSIYGTLQKYSEQDPGLRTLLARYPLANLKCGNTLETFRGFLRDVLSNYLDIYVSLRPIDTDLVPDEDDDQNNLVLYIDSSDTDSTQAALTNLSIDKRDRLISVECTLV